MEADHPQHVCVHVGAAPAHDVHDRQPDRLAGPRVERVVHRDEARVGLPRQQAVPARDVELGPVGMADPVHEVERATGPARAPGVRRAQPEGRRRARLAGGDRHLVPDHPRVAGRRTVAADRILEDRERHGRTSGVLCRRDRGQARHRRERQQEQSHHPGRQAAVAPTFDRRHPPTQRRAGGPDSARQSARPQIVGTKCCRFVNAA